MMAGLAILASCLLVYAALHDLAVRTVPNWLSAALFCIGFGTRLADHTLLSGLAVCAGTFVILFVLWILSAMGGGDVKLWAASALLIPPLLRPELNFIMAVVLLGGVLAVLYLCLGLVVPRPQASRAGGMLRRLLRAEAWRISKKAPLPYACAIAGGAILTFLPFTLQRLGSL